ncbi:MAG: UDP-N-acetylglucosamine--LPS N-acetylglucosamine transferase, partial [Caldilineaceae bacterium]|nr:UDP-N-acetylglucosamine--LPS N-acetylglucosamine transferase [Caldilineaceae bacterium]
MARILIFYSPFGSGHLSASRALREAFIEHNEHVVIVEDIFEHIGSALRAAV